jgi:hypothetical protein
MKDDDIHNLLGGFASGTLTDLERERLFTAALKNQELFDALADEEVLRELLGDPVSREQLLAALEPEPPGNLTWIWRPAFWAVAVCATTLLAVGILRQARPPATQMAEAVLPKPEPPAVARMEVRQQPQNEPAPVRIVRRTGKMKVAVLDFDSGPARRRKRMSARPLPICSERSSVRAGILSSIANRSTTLCRRKI